MDRVIVLASDRKNDLMQLIKNQVIETRGKNDRPFILSSGETSYYYYNMKCATLDCYGSNLIGDIMLEMALKLGAKSIGGLEIGSVPIATAIALKSNNTKNPITAFFVRKKPKQHGDEAEVEGIVRSPVIIVDDVITSGKSALKAVERIQALGNKVLQVIAIVNRQSAAEAKELFREHGGIDMSSIFTHNDFKDYIKDQIEMKTTNMGEVKVKSIAGK